jgi:hypothetical protein
MQPLPNELSHQWKLQCEAHTFFRGLGWHRQGTQACEKRGMNKITIAKIPMVFEREKILSHVFKQQKNYPFVFLQ